MWTKSRDSVHKRQFLKRKESRSGSNRGPSTYQPSALPLGHTSSKTDLRLNTTVFITAEGARILRTFYFPSEGVWASGDKIDIFLSDFLSISVLFFPGGSVVTSGSLRIKNKISWQLFAFSLCSSGLISALLVLSTVYLFMKVSLSPDLILFGGLGLKHQLTN